jgi:hypothetical protein
VAVLSSIATGVGTHLCPRNPPRHVLAGAAEQGQLEVVDDPRTIGRHVGDEAALHQVDQKS